VSKRLQSSTPLHTEATAGANGMTNVIRLSLMVCLAASLHLGCAETVAINAGLDDGGDAGGRDVPSTGREPRDRDTTPTPPIDATGDVDTNQDGDTDDELPLEGPVAVPDVPATGVVGEPVRFDGSNSRHNDPDGEITGFEWELGDGAVASGVVLEHTYNAPGTINGTLTVFDEDGLSHSAPFTIEITGEATLTTRAIITLEESVVPLGVAARMSGELSTAGSGTIESYEWTITGHPDGPITGEGVEFIHAFDELGNFAIRLIVTDSAGDGDAADATLRVALPPVAEIAVLTDPPRAEAPVQVSGSPSNGNGTPIGNYTWTLPEGATATGITTSFTPATAGTYEVELTVTNGAGLSDATVATIEVQGGASSNLPPIAAAGPDRDAQVGQAITFNGSSSSDPDGTIVSYQWNFGDGNTGSGVNAVHSYSAVGTYTVTLTVTDNFAATGTDTATVTVTRVNRPPVASFTVSPTDPTPGSVVQLNASASTDPDGDPIVEYAWDLGDGSPVLYGVNQTHAFATEGTYVVTLTVTDSQGDTGTTTRNVVVSDVPPINGRYRVRPFDAEASETGDCNDFITVTVGPADCDMNADGSNLTMTCGADTFRGTLSGDSFTLTLDRRDQNSGFCGMVYFTEVITGSFVNENRWEGSTTLGLRMVSPDFWCDHCEFLPFAKTGTRL